MHCTSAYKWVKVKKVDYSVRNDSHSADTTGDLGERMSKEMGLQTFSKKQSVTGADVTFRGGVLHSREVATGKARSPMVERQVRVGKHIWNIVAYLGRQCWAMGWMTVKRPKLTCGIVMATDKGDGQRTSISSSSIINVEMNGMNNVASSLATDATSRGRVSSKRLFTLIPGNITNHWQSGSGHRHRPPVFSQVSPTFVATYKLLHSES